MTVISSDTNWRECREAFHFWNDIHRADPTDPFIKLMRDKCSERYLEA